MNIKKYLTLLFAQLCVLTAAAAEKAYISDFSIKAGESKLIAICFDSERADLKRLEGTIEIGRQRSVDDLRRRAHQRCPGAVQYQHP